MKLIVTIFIFLLLATVAVNSCRKSDVRKYPRPATVNFEVPEGFPQPVFDFTSHPLTAEGIALGRKLFHESKLSAYNDVNCGNCHQQAAAFTQFDHDLGHGTNHQHTTRNVPGIFNMVWHPSMQWDGSVAGLAEQPMACIMAPEKMGETPEGIVQKIKSDNSYKELFGKAFGDDNITSERIAGALTQFVASIVSANSKYDKVKKGQAVFNSSEQAGYELFKSKCASCHQEPLFTDFSFRNVGLEINQFHPDYGRMQVTNSSSDSLKFKVPSLRNVGLTGYYTHDGRFPEFTQMIEHYSSGIIQGPTLDPSLQNGIPLSNLEKFYLQEFLYTLSDSVLISDPKYSE